MLSIYDMCIGTSHYLYKIKDYTLLYGIRGYYIY
jgi:hypothetical protein